MISSVYDPAMRIGVYGLGRFGAFWARCLAEKNTVLGYSRNPERDAPDGVLKVGEEELLKCDAIFLCVAISAMEEVVSRVAERSINELTIFDTCSVKVHPIAVMERLLPGNVSIIGTHPMFGPDSGKNGISGLPLVFCPVRASTGEREYWKQEFVDMGLLVHELTPEEHDRKAAYTHGITHFMGRVLNDLKLEPSSIGTLGYEKLLEIIEQTCNDPLQLFFDLQRYNPYTGEMREKLSASFRKMQNQLGKNR